MKKNPRLDHCEFFTYSSISTGNCKNDEAIDAFITDIKKYIPVSRASSKFHVFIVLDNLNRYYNKFTDFIRQTSKISK